MGVTKRAMNIGGHIVWCANIPYTMASDACHLMCQQPMSLAGEECLPVFPPVITTRQIAVFFHYDP